MGEEVDGNYRMAGLSWGSGLVTHHMYDRHLIFAIVNHRVVIESWGRVNKRKSSRDII